MNLDVLTNHERLVKSLTVLIYVVMTYIFMIYIFMIYVFMIHVYLRPHY